MTVAANAEVAELFVEALVTATAAQAEVAELFVETLVTGTSAGAEVSELYVEALVYVDPVVVQRCQLWWLTRQDGVQFHYTSHDVDVPWCGMTFKACGSLNASAATSTSEIGQAGDVELDGILTDDAITDQDLHAGLFDDCYVEVWQASWNDPTDIPRRLGAGWMGKVSRGEHTWKSEVIGPGERLTQTALVDFYIPACRFTFGLNDHKTSGCPVDADSLKAAGMTVVSSIGRTVITFAGAEPTGAFRQWNGGKVRWLTGRNAGVTLKVDVTDWTTPVLSVWDVCPFPPQAGDTFDLLPGCDHTKAACKDYDAFITADGGFGGFSDVPGPDAMQSNADSLFTGANG